MKKALGKRILASVLSCAVLTAFTGGWSGPLVSATAEEHVNRTGVDFTQVTITDDFWQGRQKQVVCTLIQVGIQKVEASGGGLNNFIQASLKNRGEDAAAFEGDVYFLDSDTYKMLEAMSYGLELEANGDSEILAAQQQIRDTIEKWIPYIQGAQEEDGYLDTFFTLDRGSQAMSATTAETEKWTDFAAHELYVAGHLYEAAAALYRAEGDTRLLDVAVKNADLVNSLFGEGGTICATSGHQEIELALIKLAAVCQEAEADGAQGAYAGSYGQRSQGYIALAKRFLDLRGTPRTGTAIIPSGRRPPPTGRITPLWRNRPRRWAMRCVLCISISP